MKLLRAVFFIATLFTAPATAQNAGTVANHAYAIGKGAGVTGYTSLLCGAGQLAVSQAGADPACRTVSGDWTLNAAGVSTLTTVNSNVGSFGSATSCPAFTVNAKGLTTAASATTCTPAIGSVTGLGTGIVAALAANTGSTGAPVLFNGALGTPTSGVGTNLTALNASSLGSGTVPAARTNGHQNGTATNDNAAAGELGEIVSASVAAPGSAITASTPINITSITLSAGDWDVFGYVAFAPAAATSVTQYLASVSTTSATIDVTTPFAFNQQSTAAQVPGGLTTTIITGPVRVSVASNTTVFIVARSIFTASTMTAYGGIRARRVR